MGRYDKSTQNKGSKKKQDLWVIIIISLVALVIVALLVISEIKTNQPAPTATPTSAASGTGLITPVAAVKPNADGLNLGNPDAKVKVIEFADFQCPWCQYYWQQLEPTIISQYVETGKVYYSYSPMAFVGQESADALEAAYCANDQGKFWEYRDYLFTNLTGENVGSYAADNLVAFAQSLKLDMNAFNQCLASDTYAQKYVEDNQTASNLGVNTTPSFIVNGKVVSMNELQQTIEDELAK